jgi:hypothetical protein
MEDEAKAKDSASRFYNDKTMEKIRAGEQRGSAGRATSDLFFFFFF